MKNHRTAIFLLILLATFVATGFVVGAQDARADHPGHQETTEKTPPPNTPATSNAGSGGTESSATILAAGIVYVLLYALKTLMDFLLALAGNALDYMLTLNVNANPVNLPGVLLGWRIARDLANSVFILVVLWIAFKIIFSLETLGGSQTLARVIILAIFINFSLALVSAVFGVSNILASTFSDNLPRADQKIRVSDFITNALGIQRVNQAVDPQTAENQARQNQIRQQNLGINPADAAFAPGTTDTFLAAIGVERAQAVSKWCFILSPASCLVDAALESSWLRTLFDIQGNATQNILTYTLNLAVITVLLSVMTATFAIGAIGLFIRFFAMTFLSIGAPLALLSAVLPSDPQGYTKQLWDWWKKSLISWAMFAPVFYFLVYLSLVILDQYHQAFGRPLPPQVNVESYIGAFISLGLMIAAYKIARKSGGAVADVAVQWGKIGAGFALGAVTGGVGAAGVIGAGRILKPGGFVSQTVDKAAGSRFGRIVTRAVSPALSAAGIQKKIKKFREQRGKEIEEKEKEYGTYDKKSTFGAALSAVLPATKAALYSRIIKQDWLKDFRASGGSAEDMQSTLAQFGLESLLNKQLPHLIKKLEDIAPTIKGMTTDEKVKIDADSLAQADATIRKAILESLWDGLDREDYGKIANKNTKLQELLKDHIEGLAPPDLGALKGKLGTGRVSEFDRYFDGSVANGVGVPLKPNNWDAAQGPGPQGVQPLSVRDYTAQVTPGTPYPGRVSVTGGQGPFTLSVVGGALPPGLTGIDSTGAFIGVVDPTVAPGTLYQADIEVMDQNGQRRRFRVNLTAR